PVPPGGVIEQGAERVADTVGVGLGVRDGLAAPSAISVTGSVLSNCNYALAHWRRAFRKSAHDRRVYPKPK
ncbi:MAG TPA: hypothetical protein VIY29_02335, partial [Ktedonobacteraceae bacterium]